MNIRGGLQICISLRELLDIPEAVDENSIVAGQRRQRMAFVDRGGDRWVFPVGRLDMDTSGLLILTNDTQYGEALLQPESKIPKTYYVKAAGVFAAGDYFDLAYGLDIGRGETSGRAIVREVRVNDKYTWFELTITEGKNRQVRRMCDAIGHAVLKLVRIRIGDLSLGDLPVGQFKVLNHEEAQKALQK